jgi:hypothetical protein
MGRPSGEVRYPRVVAGSPKMGKGITLTAEELKSLRAILDSMDL